MGLESSGTVSGTVELGNSGRRRAQKSLTPSKLWCRGQQKGPDTVLIGSDTTPLPLQLIHSYMARFSEGGDREARAWLLNSMTSGFRIQGPMP